jgi:chromosomal replication initiator protein
MWNLLIKQGYINMQMFENFFTCPENSAAAAIAKQITISPDINYNPFFIHGNTGLGKTHLLTAIKEQLYLTRPGMEVIYITVDELVEKFIYSIQTNTQLEFKTKYRNSDILMIDDLDNIKNKEGVGFFV